MLTLFVTYFIVTCLVIVTNRPTSIYYELYSVVHLIVTYIYLQLLFYITCISVYFTYIILTIIVFLLGYQSIYMCILHNAPTLLVGCCEKA